MTRTKDGALQVPSLFSWISPSLLHSHGFHNLRYLQFFSYSRVLSQMSTWDSDRKSPRVGGNGRRTSNHKRDKTYRTFGILEHCLTFASSPLPSASSS